MIKDIKNTILGLEVLGIPKKITDLENRKFPISPPGISRSSVQTMLNDYSTTVVTDARYFYSDYFVTTDWVDNGTDYDLTVTHNLDSQDLNITVYEGLDVVLPESITIIDDNSIKLTVPDASIFDGTIVVSAVKQATGDAMMTLEDGTYLLNEDGTYLLL